MSGFLNLVQAQSESNEVATDSSTYDLGRLTLKKRNVQAVTIKAADLEKMPFTDLKSAINIYTYGVYSAHQSYVYVIDGILNADVNAYSIYDIDEITMVQNAAAVLNGVDATKTLILVKTKHGGSEARGVTIAGQSEFIRLTQRSPYTFNNSSAKYPKSNDMYHQYYVSAYGNSDMIKAGISAEILHNTLPYGYYVLPASTNTPAAPISSNRFKFNGYLDVKLGDANLLTVNAGYVPQRDRSNNADELAALAGSSAKYVNSFYNSQNLFYTDVKLATIIAEGFTNKISAGFERLRDHGESLAASYNANGTLQGAGSRRDSTSSVNSFVATEDITYRAQLENFSLQPNVNFTFRQVNNPHSAQFASASNGAFRNFLDNNYTTKQKLGILTPSIAFSYLDWLIVQGGFQTYFNSTAKPTVQDHDQTQPLPFASVSIDLLTPLQLDTDQMRLNIYGSYARNFNYSNDKYGSLIDQLYIHPGNNARFDSQPDPYQVYTQIQGGAVFSVLENKLSFSYNYSLKRFSTTQVVLIRLPGFTDMFQNTEARVELHRVGIDFALPTDGDFSWRTSLNGTYVLMRDNYKVRNYLPEYLRLTYPGKPFITGGFVNHLNFKNAYLDFGMIYALNQALLAHTAYSRTWVVTGKVNIFNLQNIDLGYKLQVKAVKSLEVYANARNLIQSDQFKYIENRRYIGAGFKVGL
ncbi:hypothetical protein GCM10022392_13240 [Mucilaginibacter panaciglaebae]|uniref:TonB-dependent receptor n=2 Tax=Mucilaginibacter panaciglaebae TaxID=502331 RepID=A0ABP7WNJ9_9SPHI